ncbi:arylesterase [Rhodovulum sp. PH10]|uniref:arylesterase n=1 Tax=Rhodovulum sp. PH10 TaxID=1187851 RepID=UPI001ED97A7F|nr:arylesterase [Rhodovulum sp. PH10]
MVAALAGLLAAIVFYVAPATFSSARAEKAGERPLKVVLLGDSLTAGYGLPPGDGFAAQLRKALAEGGHPENAPPVEIVDAGVSGDTTTDGLARLDWAVPSGTDAVVVELGANDALRGIDPAVTRKALGEILRRLKARGIPVLLAGMKAPPNMGTDYKRAFDVIFPDLAKAYDSVLYPFFLEGVAAQPSLNQADGMHPNAAGVRVIVRGILPRVEELIARAAARRDRS